MKCCEDYCESCKEHHPPESMCPPYEVRTTGITWLWQRLDHLEEVLAKAQAENRLLQAAVVEALNKCGHAIEQRDTLQAAITMHHSQKADDRCWEDDSWLYAAAGLPSHDHRVGDKAAMLKNCERFLALRCINCGWPTYADLEAKVLRSEEAVSWSLVKELGRLRARVAELEAEKYPLPDLPLEE